MNVIQWIRSIFSTKEVDDGYQLLPACPNKTVKVDGYTITSTADKFFVKGHGANFELDKSCSVYGCIFGDMTVNLIDRKLSIKTKKSSIEGIV